MAVEEVRELKRTNADLETKLKSRGSSVAPASGGAMDWEAQKQRLLASLEADDDPDEEAVAERTSIEATIRITDQIVTQKDRELADLRQRLDQSAGGMAAAAQRSSDTADILDSDEIICQEREKLIQMQAEWREKIGKAEIDLSVQRAKLARERIELDEKLRQLHSEQENHPSNESRAEADKPTRGRWLARLGLKDLDEGK